MLKWIKNAITVVFFLCMFAAFLIFILEIPGPWSQWMVRAEETEHSPSTRPHMPATELVKEKGLEHTLCVPEAVRRALGIRIGNEDRMAVANRPTEYRPLELPGSTALNPAKIVRIRARFAPAEVKEIGQAKAINVYPARELRSGDEVKAGDLLGVFHSVDVGSKKNDLFEAIVQYRLDKVILDRAEKQASALPDVFLWNARRNVQTDSSGVIRARNTLKTWNIPAEDIKAVEKEANDANLTEKQKTDASENKDQQDRWSRVEVRSPCNGVIVEQNVSKGEIIVDSTINIFTIAQVERLAVFANLPESDLPLVQSLNQSERKWKVSTIRTNGGEPIEGKIDEIGYIIDPNQHTAIIKGYIDNPGKEIRAGQFIRATIHLPPPENVVEIPADAIVEDGKQSVVFVERDAEKNYYTMRRVVVTHRFGKTVYVSSTELPPAQQIDDKEKELGFLPRKPLLPKERILVAGVMELKAALLEQEARQRQQELNQSHEIREAKTRVSSNPGS